MQKIQALKLKKNTNRGMTYLELIIVLSIFGIMSSITLTTYKDFQDYVNLKSFSNSMALKFSEAQKNSVNGKLIDGGAGFSPNTWVPAYGIKFDFSISNTAFIHFVNLDNSVQFPNFACTTYACSSTGFQGPYHNTNALEEVLERLSLDKGYYISNLSIRGNGVSCPPQQNTNVQNLELLFIRPTPNPYIFVSGLANCPFELVQYADITIASPSGKQTIVRIHKTGQIQLI